MLHLCNTDALLHLGELLKLLVKKTAKIVYKLLWAGTPKEKLRKHEESLIFPMVFDSACDLLARKILEAAQLVTLLPEAVITML